MIATAIKTDKIIAGSVSLLELLDASITELQEGSVVAITSKIVSLCENNVAPMKDTNKEQLMIQESDLYLPESLSKYKFHFTITNNRLIPMAGIDESNGNGMYVLWPKDAQATANQVRLHLRQRFGLQLVGVVITDSTSQPLRRGTGGIVLAHSGFAALNNYVGKPDLFGKPFSVSRSDVAGGLAATAVMLMGEGTEQTPIAILSDLPFVAFQDRNPSDEELAEIAISLEDDMFAPFLNSVEWKKGARSQK